MEQVAPRWRKASYSENGANCVEVADPWRTSSYTGTGVNCVEVASPGRVIVVRDSKDRAGGTIAFPAGAWARFTASLK
jgi:hypothetical protein